jgi:hypothetical protein
MDALPDGRATAPNPRVPPKCGRDVRAHRIKGSDSGTSVKFEAIPAKKPLLNDKPMTIEMGLSIEWSRDRPIGHP